jgi:hypothetical protein
MHEAMDELIIDNDGLSISMIFDVCKVCECDSFYEDSDKDELKEE